MSNIEPGWVYLMGYSLEPKGRHVRELSLEKIPNPPGREFPSEHCTLYYGAQTTLKEMSKIHAAAIRNKQHLYQITVAVNVGKIIVERLAFEDLKKTRFLNMEGISTLMEERIQGYWSGYLRQEGRDDQWIRDNVDWGSRRFISDRPDLVPRLAEEPEFSHLALIVYQVAAGSEMLKVGTILDRAAMRAECKADPSVFVNIP